jgi:hypothetical protein
MTGRRAPPSRPTTPTDPTLIARPVPRKRTFPIRSFGPGATIDAPTTDPSRWTARAQNAWWKEFNRAAGPCECDERENLAVLKTIRQSEAVVWRDDDVLVPQPTWGFYVFLTDYDQVTRDSTQRAMENWVELIRQMQGVNANPPDLYANEAFRRFKLDLVDEQEALAGASIDRVRECFRAHVRSLEITNDNDEEDLWVGPTRNLVCLVLNADKVQMLANLTFRDDTDPVEYYRTYGACVVQAVGIKWQRPEVTSSRYRGTKDLSIVFLARAYSLLDNGDLEGYVE